MWNITAEEWNKFVSMFFKIDNEVLEQSLQTYPFSRLSSDEKKNIASVNFYNFQIKNGEFFTKIDNFKVLDNALQKNNGDLRVVSLVPPIIYLIFIVIGGHLSKKFDGQLTRQNALVYYAGSYLNDDLYYSNSYKEFSITVQEKKVEYTSFYKTDFSNFFSSIDVSLLFSIIQDNCDEDARSLLVYRNLLEFYGKGKFPVIDSNPGLSYLAANIFLSRFDSVLSKKLEREMEITRFKIIRYVDDIYIFYTCFDLFGTEDLSIKQKIQSMVQDTAQEMQLTTNHEKQIFGLAENVSAEVEQSLYDHRANGEDVEYEKYFNIDNLSRLLSELLKLGKDTEFNQVELVFKTTLSDENFNFSYTEILNWFLYQKMDMFETSDIENKLAEIVKHHSFLFQYYTKQFVKMLINTRNGEAIKRFLNQTFNLSKLGYVSNYRMLMILEYLLSTHFHHSDLLDLVKQTNLELSNYICNYCKKVDIFKTFFKDSKIQKDKMYLIQADHDASLNFLLFMAKVYKQKNMILEEFAFFKNYFDRKLAFEFAQLGISGATARKKVSFKYTYNVGNVKTGLKELGIEDLDDLIKKAYKFRNENPVSHASSEIFEEQNLKTKDLKLCIEQLSGALTKLEKLAERDE